MHKDVKSNGNWTAFPLKAGDVVRLIRNDDVMVEFVNPYDDAELSSYLKRAQRIVEFK